MINEQKYFGINLFSYLEPKHQRKNVFEEPFSFHSVAFNSIYIIELNIILRIQTMNSVSRV